MNDNVINFPERNTRKVDTYDDMLIKEAGEVSQMIVENAMDTLNRHGCKFEDQSNILPYMILLFESIRSLYLLSKNERHPLQIVAEDLFSYDIS